MGLAWIGTICFPDSFKGYRAGINECFTKDLTSAEVKTFCLHSYHFHVFLFNSLNVLSKFQKDHCTRDWSQFGDVS